MLLKVQPFQYPPNIINSFFYANMVWLSFDKIPLSDGNKCHENSLSCLIFND